MKKILDLICIESSLDDRFRAEVIEAVNKGYVPWEPVIIYMDPQSIDPVSEEPDMRTFCQFFVKYADETDLTEEIAPKKKIVWHVSEISAPEVFDSQKAWELIESIQSTEQALPNIFSTFELAKEFVHKDINYYYPDHGEIKEEPGTSPEIIWITTIDESMPIEIRYIIQQVEVDRDPSWQKPQE